MVYTHGIAGLIGGLLVGILADPNMTEYGVKGAHYKGPGGFSVRGWFYGHSFHQLWEQTIAAAWIICWTAFGTCSIFYVVKFLLKGLREADETLRDRRRRDPRGGGLPRARPSVSPSTRPATFNIDNV